MYKNGSEGGQGDNVHFFMKATRYVRMYKK